jgi:ATP-binding cassette subfamily G (WHITE) protein 2 (PDR)
VELAAKPKLLLFLDEPTSGLDSQTAWSVASLIRKLSDNGQAVLCTIHQPSALLFQQFDRLLLLAKGGKTVYFGDIGVNSSILISYFETNGAEKCGRDENPAEWMLKVLGAAPGAKTNVDWHAVWRASSERENVRKEVLDLENAWAADLGRASAARKGDDEEGRMYAAPLWTQFSKVSERVFQQYWRTPSYIYSKFVLCGGTVSLKSYLFAAPFPGNEVSY